MNAKEFYAAERARQAKIDLETRAELAGYWKGCDGAERVAPIEGELATAWLRGYDNGAAAAAAKKVAA